MPRSRAQIALSFAPLVRAAAPAVVNIHTRKALPRSPTYHVIEDAAEIMVVLADRRELRAQVVGGSRW